MKMLTVVCILFFYLLHFSASSKMIAFSGLSGTGKSTLAKAVAKELSAVAVTEPEEHDWPKIIQNRDLYGPANAMLAFRQLWAEQFIDADRLSKSGRLVVVDTYFLKICADYLNKPGMEWLVEQDHPYLQTLIALGKLDQTQLPDADCVVLFECTLDDWRLFLKSRGRNWVALAITISRPVN